MCTYIYRVCMCIHGTQYVTVFSNLTIIQYLAKQRYRHTARSPPFPTEVTWNISECGKIHLPSYEHKKHPLIFWSHKYVINYMIALLICPTSILPSLFMGSSSQDIIKVQKS